MLTIGELAARTGSTPRALRLYERRGLLRADRTPAGRRVYSSEHVTILLQIRTLKSMGLTLDAIGGILRARTLNAGELIDLRLAQIEAEQARLHTLQGKLKSARAALAAGPTDALQLCELLSEPGPASFHQWLDRWFTPVEQAAWQKAMATSSVKDSWEAVHARVRLAIAAGVAPESATGAALAAQWQAVMRPIIDAVGTHQWNKGAALAEQAFSQPAGQGQQSAADVHAWLARALQALSWSNDTLPTPG